MDEYTKGPWRVDAGKQESLAVRANDGLVASIPGYGIGKRKADAHLISAAPELLAVLKKYWKGRFFDGVTYQDAEIIEAAIAKAEGNSLDE